MGKIIERVRQRQARAAARQLQERWLVESDRKLAAWEARHLKGPVPQHLLSFGPPPGWRPDQGRRDSVAPFVPTCGTEARLLEKFLAEPGQHKTPEEILREWNDEMERLAR